MTAVVPVASLPFLLVPLTARKSAYKQQDKSHVQYAFVIQQLQQRQPTGCSMITAAVKSPSCYIHAHFCCYLSLDWLLHAAQQHLSCDAPFHQQHPSRWFCSSGLIASECLSAMSQLGAKACLLSSDGLGPHVYRPARGDEHHPGHSGSMWHSCTVRVCRVAQHMHQQTTTCSVPV